MHVKNLLKEIALIGFLISGAVVFFWPTGVSRDRNPMRSITRIHVLDTIPQRLGVHRNMTGSYPSTEAGIASAKRLPAQYSSNAETDPWGRLYQYRFPATRSKKPYDLWSLGPDATDSSDDITNW